MTLKSVIATVLLSTLLVVSRAIAAQTFGYLGTEGPAYWGGLSPEWSACSSGHRQSPVDFSRGYPPAQQRLAIDYGPTTGEVVNNGHTIEVETEGHDTLTLDGVAYKLVQFHFHSGSEHRVAGVGFDMELHLVHANASGQNAVIAVLLNRAAGSGPLLPIFSHLPTDVNVKHELDGSFNPKSFLPPSMAHYRYAGSLTTPPCTEGVQWIVMKDPMTVSSEDLAQFHERIHFNARPVQRTLGAQH
jgi:carbonic anhydrase